MQLGLSILECVSFGEVELRLQVDLRLNLIGHFNLLSFIKDARCFSLLVVIDVENLGRGVDWNCLDEATVVERPHFFLRWLIHKLRVLVLHQVFENVTRRLVALVPFGHVGDVWFVLFGSDFIMKHLLLGRLDR